MTTDRTPTIPYRADLDGIRGLAILLVLAYHVAPTQVPGGFAGVDVFFVLSGFLITRILLEDRRAGRVQRFYGRRLRRLAPSLILVLGVTLVLGSSILLDDAFERLGRHTAAAAGFVANFAFWSEAGYFDADALDKPLLHLWSLGIEEQFYLVWPAAIWLLARRRMASSLALGAAVVSFVACQIWVTTSPDSAFYLPWFRGWQPLAGAALAGYAGARTLANRGYASLVGWLGLLAVLIGAVSLGGGRSHPDLGALLPTLGTVAMIAAGDQSSLGKVLSWRPLIQLGQISYALYLWHWPLLSLFADPRPDEGLGSRIGLCLLAVILAIATTRWIERPIRRSTKSTTVIALAITLLLTIGVGLWVSMRGGSTTIRHPGVERVGEAMERDRALRSAIDDRPCDELDAGLPQEDLYCRTFGNSPPQTPLLVWGDSVAESWWPTVQALAAEQGRDAVVLSFSGCPPILGVRSGTYANCTIEDAAWKRQLIESLEPSHVYLTARWAAYSGPTEDLPAERHFVSSEPQGPINVESTREALTARLPQTLGWLADLAPTTVIAAVPDLATSLPRAALLDLDPRRSTASHRDQQSFVRALFDEAVSSDSRLRLVDPAERLCQGEKCLAVWNETFIYQDDNHVSAQGALLFVDLLEPDQP